MGREIWGERWEERWEERGERRGDKGKRGAGLKEPEPFLCLVLDCLVALPSSEFAHSALHCHFPFPFHVALLTLHSQGVPRCLNRELIRKPARCAWERAAVQGNVLLQLSAPNVLRCIVG